MCYLIYLRVYLFLYKVDFLLSIKFPLASIVDILHSWVCVRVRGVCVGGGGASGNRAIA